ncbi:MAG: NAD(P)/FAD-dependent oxidoreductase [Pirellulaceae bacterium]|nr:NAD(P)/FAD-dependent oxidoreductase [Pirellulaceae bacterium]
MMQNQATMSTIDATDVSRRKWDVIVAGAGPAGSVAARQLALRGVAVLLVDKAEFPRRKVCGCYLSGSALATLQSIGLGNLCHQSGAPCVTRVRIGTQGRTVCLTLPAGAALSRETLDTALAKSAVDAGAELLCHTAATVGRLTSSGRSFDLKCGNQSVASSARMIVVADGVGGQSLKDCSDVRFKVATRSRVGIAAMTDTLPDGYVTGTIHMAIGRAGYVGALQLETGSLDVAAALDPTVLKHFSPGELAQKIVDESGLPRLDGLEQVRWRGTPPLTRTPTRPGASRLLLIGDAAGYVEPFTGEGMSWAIASGCAVVPFVLESLSSGSDDLAKSWGTEHRRLLGSRQRLCRLLTRGLRSPLLAGVSVRTLAMLPSLATPFINRLNRPPSLESA